MDSERVFSGGSNLYRQAMMSVYIDHGMVLPIWAYMAEEPLLDLTQEKWPCCVMERMAFMALFEYVHTSNHPYKHTSEESHRHFDETPLRHPVYCSPWKIVRQ